MKKVNIMLRLFIIAFFAAGVISVCPFLGITGISIMDVTNNDTLRHIFLMIRVPRTFAAFIAGGGLAVAGMVFQALFRNPLASPYTLGVSGGASLGAAVTISFGAGGSLLGFSMVSLGSFAGAAGAVLLVYLFAWSRESNSTTLLLAGVVVATVCSGLVMFVHYISSLSHSFQIMRWIMGGVDGISWKFLVIMSLPVFVYLCGVGIMLSKLDHFLTGDSLAHSRGIDVHKSRNTLIIITALAVGAIVSVCGPIGFVGIMAPHACRMLLPGIRHRLLSAASFLTGGIFLTLCDTLARTISPPTEIPVGIITALFGGPFFLIILFKKKGLIQL